MWPARDSRILLTIVEVGINERPLSRTCRWVVGRVRDGAKFITDLILVLVGTLG